MLSKSPGTRLGNLGALVRAARSMDPASTQPHRAIPKPALENVPAISETVRRKRRMIAMFCKMLFEQLLDGNQQLRSDSKPLSPRQRQTLQQLLAGKSEKEIATGLSISRHTVHVYVKSLYKLFGVSSRGELLARWVQP